ncbi:MAG: CHAD domain-containing protein [Phenylobacterium sp.]|uniref:CYTH and CHAD domain-containing protein n=1 Tax=Phenylobacterium sp. TaxID=1871053 RepID=UPI00391B01F6
MDVGSAEIELKFLCEPSDLEAVLAAAPDGETVRKDLVSTYFDTPQEDLRAKRISLRIRESGGKRVQTLKRGDGFAREEYEKVLDGEELDLAMTALSEALSPSKRKTLRPAFTVRVRRRQRTFHYEGAVIEIAADEGEVEAQGRKRRISELELELKGGDCAPMFELARRLSRTAPLYLSFEGKSSQGQALREGREAEARRHDRTPLPAEGTAGEAFAVVARNTLSQIAANGALIREAPNPDAIHQLRVAARRLRSALSTFKPLLARDEMRGRLRDELKWLAGALDEARDLDVLVGVDGGEASELGRAAEPARRRAYAKAAAAAASGRFRELLLEATAWVETGDWRSTNAAEKPARAFAAKALDRRLKALSKRGRRLARQDDAGRHEARIAAKKLRYAAEAFAPLFGAEASAAYVKRLKRLQEALGAANDAAVAREVVQRLDLKGPARAAAEAALAERAFVKAEAVEAAEAAMDRLLETAPFWR